MMEDIDLTDPLTDDLSIAVESDTESYLHQIIDIVKNAKSLPLSTSVRVERDEMLGLLEDAIDKFPEELRQARWLLKERDDFLAKVQREADEILEQARSRAEQMVQRTEIVREAQRQAQKTIDEANETARRMRLEAEDYCDQKLAAFEIVLDRTQKTVRSGREKLRATPLPVEEAASGFFGSVEDENDETFFDQDGH